MKYTSKSLNLKCDTGDLTCKKEPYFRCVTIKRYIKNVIEKIQESSST
jgi:hypothetical protein